MFNLNPFKALTIVYVLAILPAVVFAGGQGSGGGNRIGLQAASALKLVPVALKKYGTNLVSSEQLKVIDQLVDSKNTLIMIVDQAPIACAAGIQQKGTAYSTSGEKGDLIQIYSEDWKKLNSVLSEEVAFMAHEVAVLRGWENTGTYGAISSPLRNKLLQPGNTLVSIYDECISEINLDTSTFLSDVQKASICSKADTGFQSCMTIAKTLQSAYLRPLGRVELCNEAGAGFDACYNLAKNESTFRGDRQKVVVCSKAKSGFQDCYDKNYSTYKSNARAITACGSASN